MKNGIKKARNLIIQIFVLLILFIVAFLALGYADLIGLPEFIENIFPSDSGEKNETADSGNKVFDYLSDSFPKEQANLYPTISAENLNVILNSLETRQSFYWESVSEIYSGENVVKRYCKSRISGNKYNVEILDGSDNIIKKIVCNGTQTVVTKYSDGVADSGAYSQGIFDFYSDASLISVDYFKNSDFSNENCEIKLIQNEDYNLVSISYEYDRNGTAVKNNCSLSLDYGVVLFAESYENGILVFKQTTKSVNPLTVPNDDLFSVNLKQ